jgi:hypothetical protein
MTMLINPRPPRLLWTAIWFVIAGLFGCMIISLTLKPGGALAVASPVLAFFAGSFLAAGELHLGLRGRIGFGIAGTLSTFGSLMALVSTQAAFSFLLLIIAFLLYNVIGAALGLVIALSRNTGAFKYGLLGFAVGSLISGIIVAVEMQIGFLKFNTGLPLIPIPLVTGALFTAWALRKKGRTDQEQDQ